MSKGMAAVRPDRSSGPTDSSANRPTGRAPSSGTADGQLVAQRRRSGTRRRRRPPAPGSRSRSAPSGGGRRRPAPRALPRSRVGRAVPPARPAPRRAAQSSGPGEPGDVDGMGVEDLQDLGAGPGRDPQDHLVEAEAGEVVELGLGRDRAERHHPGQAGVAALRPRTPGAARGWPRPAPIRRWASSRRRTRRWPRSCRRWRPRRAGRARRAAAPASVGSSTGRGRRTPRGTRPGRRATAPACTGRAPGRWPGGRRRPRRGRPPRPGSSRSRCRARPAHRSGGRGWPPAWPARSGRAGRPAPRRSRGPGRSVTEAAVARATNGSRLRL